MARIFWTFASIVLFIAFVLEFIASISLPFLTALEVVSVDFASDSGKVVVQSVEPVGTLKLGIWGFCITDASNNDQTCDHPGHDYSFLIQGPTNGQTERVQGSWTNGLAVHPVATAAIFVAFLLSLSTHLLVSLIASLVSFLAALLTLISFAIDIALFVLVQNAVGNLNDVDAKTHLGAGFWLTLVAFILTLLGGSTVCFGRHRARKARAAADAEKKMVETTVTPDYDSDTPFWKKPFSRFRRS